MIAAVSNLDISWPDPKVAGNDQINKFIQCSNQYIYPTASTNDAVSSSIGLSNVNLGYKDMTISKDGIITIPPLLAAGSVYFYDTKNGASSAGATKPGNIGHCTYAAWNNRFYYNATPTGLYWVSAASTGSALTLISGSAGKKNAAIVADGNKLWVGNLYDATSKCGVYNLDTEFFTEVGSTMPANQDNIAIAPNGLLVFGSAGATVYYYDPATDTTGTFSGSVLTDSAYSWILARDGYMYAVPRFTRTSVYRADPYKKEITTVFTGAPYTTGNKKGQWMGPDGCIYTVQATNTLIGYNPITNTAFTAPFIFVYDSGRMGQGTAASDRTMYWLNSTAQLIKANNFGNNGILNDAWQGSEYNKGGMN